MHGVVGWSAYGGDALGTRYSSLAEISAVNTDQLRIVWIFRADELSTGVKDWTRSAFEATPNPR
jgi:quinoprotein glucose dehydrogenase